MRNSLARNWWMVALRGLFAVLFGVMALIWPHLTVGVLVILFGAYALADGVFALVTAVQHREQVGALIFEGVAGIAAGIAAFLWPGITALALLYLIAIWAIGTGVFEIIAATRLRKQIPGEMLLILSGICSVVFGVLLLLRPGVGALAVVGLIAAYSIVFGILMIALAFRLHAVQKPHTTGVGDSAHVGV